MTKQIRIETPDGRTVFRSSESLGLLSYLDEDDEKSGVFIHDKGFSLFQTLTPEQWDAIIDVIADTRMRSYAQGRAAGRKEGREDMAGTIQQALGVDMLIKAMRGEKG